MGRHKKKPDANNMTPRQQAVYEYIKKSVIEKNYPPSIRDICKCVGLKSTSSVFTYINDLIKMGLLQKDPSRPRTLTITEPGFRDELSKSSCSDCDFVQVPLYDPVTTGIPLIHEDNITEIYPMARNMLPDREVFMMTVFDDSMKNCGILEGDKVIVQQQDICDDGDIAAVAVGNDVIIRRYFKKGSGARLKPENDSINPVILPECKVLGLVIGLIRMGIR